MGQLENRIKCQKLILHIGVHKTGTTAIQSFLFENIERLRDRGFYLPDYLFCPEHKPAALRYAIIKGQADKTRLLLAEIVERAKASSCHAVILSDEDYCKIAEDDLSDVRIFSEFFHEVEVVIYARRPDRQSESGFSFCVMWHESKYGGSPSQWYEENPGLDYDRLATFYQQTMPGCKIKAVSYDFNVRRLIDSFMEVCGMKLMDYQLPKKEASNVSANKYMVEVMNAVNQYPMTDKLFLEIKDYVLQHKQLQRGPKALFFSNEQRGVILKRLENSIKHFEKQFHEGGHIFEDLKPIQVPQGLEQGVKRMIVDEISKKYNLQGSKKPSAIESFSKKLRTHKSITTADIYREISMVCYDLAMYETAYRFMKLALINRPEGPTIQRKVVEYRKILNENADGEKKNIWHRQLQALFVDQSVRYEDKAAEIRKTIQKNLRLSKRMQEHEILRELALFCEAYNEWEAAYVLMSMAKNRKPTDRVIGDHCVRYLQVIEGKSEEERPIVYLHVGANKTASTSIQSTLTTNREALKTKGEGYLFPKTWRANKTRFMRYLCLENENHLKIRFKNMFGDKTIIETNQEMIDEMVAELEGFQGRNTIFSGEDLYHLTYKNLNRVRMLLELLIPNCEIKVIFVVRNYLSYMNSSTQQAAKGGSIEKDVLRIRRKKKEFFRRAVRNIRNVFGAENLELYAFEDSLKHHRGPVGYFLDRIGLDEKAIESMEIQRKNESFSDRATKMIFWLNEISARIDGVKYADNNKIRKFNKRFSCISGTSRYTLDRRKIRRLYSIMLSEARWLKEEFDIDYLDCKKKDADVPVIFEETFMQEMKDLFVQLGKSKKHIVYLCFVEQSKSWKQDRKSKETFASLAKWCQEHYPEITEKDYLRKMGQKAV